MKPTRPKTPRSLQSKKTSPHAIRRQARDSDRQRMELQLKESEIQYRALFAHVPDGVYRSSPDGKLLAANPALVRMFGYASEKEFLQVDIGKQLYRNPQARQTLVKKLEQQGELQSTELVLTRKDASQLVVLDSAHAVKDDRGNVLYFEGVLTDITARKRTEEELARYTAILAAINFAAEHFLRASSWREPIQQVIARLGQATQVSRVYIFENRFDPEGELYWRQLYESVADGITPQIDNPTLQNLSVVRGGFGRWIRIMESGNLVKSNVRELPSSEQVELNSEDIKSIVCVPIHVKHTWWGFIGFDECTAEREWSSAEIEALTAAANTLGAAIERELVDEELVRRARHLGLLNEITRTAIATPDLSLMLKMLADQLSELLNAEGCYISLWDPVRQRPIPFAASASARESNPKVQFEPDDVTMAGSVLQADRVLVAEDTLNSPYLSARLAARFSGKSVMGLPLTANGQKLGAVIIFFTAPHHFTDDETTRATQAAGQVALALAKALALQAEQQRVIELEAIRQASLGLSSSLDLPSVLDAVVESTLRLIPDAGDAHIYLYRDGRLTFGTALWFDGRRGQQWSEPRPDGLTYTVARMGEMIVVEDMQRHELFQHHNWKGAIIGLPLKIAQRVVGVMTIACKEPRPFSEDELRVLNLLAAQAALAIENAHLYDQVQLLAITDPLTGAYNRRGFFQIGDQEFERARRHQRALSVLILDVDHFKIINDTYGHTFGDKVLVALLDTCRLIIRAPDTLGRYGGEEFTALLPEADAPSAIQIAERMRVAVEKTEMQIDGKTISITISIGVVALHPHVVNFATLIDQADQALYRAKQGGRNCVELFEFPTGKTV